MNLLNTKTLRTKTFWGGVLAIVTGVASCAGGNWAGGVPSVVVGALAIFGRDAASKIQLELEEHMLDDELRERRASSKIARVTPWDCKRP